MYTKHIVQYSLHGARNEMPWSPDEEEDGSSSRIGFMTFSLKWSSWLIGRGSQMMWLLSWTLKMNSLGSEGTSSWHESSGAVEASGRLQVQRMVWKEPRRCRQRPGQHQVPQPGRRQRARWSDLWFTNTTRLCPRG